MNLSNITNKEFMKNNKIIAILENKLLVLGVVLILLFSSIGILTYKFIRYNNSQVEINKFESDMREIVLNAEKGIKDEDNKVEVKKDKAQVELSSVEYPDRDPFRKLLARKAEGPAKAVFNGNASSRQKSKEERMQEELVNNIRVLGILNNDRKKVAIIEFASLNSEVQVMKVGEEFAGLTLTSIENDEIILEKDGERFVYIFGGDEN